MGRYVRRMLYSLFTNFTSEFKDGNVDIKNEFKNV